jgi:hypothetical protein
MLGKWPGIVLVQTQIHPQDMHEQLAPEPEQMGIKTLQPALGKK